MRIKPAKDWADEFFIANSPLSKTLEPVVRQIQADALRYCVEMYDNMQRDGFTIGVEMIREYAKQLDPNHASNDRRDPVPHR